MVLVVVCPGMLSLLGGFSKKDIGEFEDIVAR
jgi:hypothetical protein